MASLRSQSEGRSQFEGPGCRWQLERHCLGKVSWVRDWRFQAVEAYFHSVRVEQAPSVRKQLLAGQHLYCYVAWWGAQEADENEGMTVSWRKVAGASAQGDKGRRKGLDFNVLRCVLVFTVGPYFGAQSERVDERASRTASGSDGGITKLIFWLRRYKRTTTKYINVH